ncbi:hypothetical protein QJS04_geneDACA003410 [Acorus gramineus]|uniref:Uncharacterized protein n=1 Tax=Acorus gramineus TaxID=55184 RepID=A0AAV9BN43_ACOGR|nr:hypothetical protein QJS04_geneDACA003410 [Acorus gramineus]
MRGLRRSLVRSVEGRLIPRATATSFRLLESNAFNEPDQPSHHALDEGDTTVCILFRYGGFWKMVKGTERRTYRLGRQKKVMLDKDYCNMDEIFEKVGKLIKWGENDALNMQYKMPGGNQYGTLSNETEMLRMFNLHHKSPIIEIFITIEHNVSSSIIPTPKDREAHNRYAYESFDEGDDDDFGEGIPPSFLVFFSDADDDLGEQMHGFSVVFEDDDEEPSIRKGREQNVTIEEIDAQEQIEPVQPSHQPTQAPPSQSQPTETVDEWIADRVWRAKCKGNNMIWGSYDDLYALVPALRESTPGEHLERLVWSAARPYTIQGHSDYMRQIEEVSKDAHSYLLSEKDHCWSRSMFDTTAKCCHLTNNLAESFNAFLGDDRAKPIIYYVDAIRVKIMTMMNKRRMAAERWKGVLVPEAHKQ